MDVMEKIGACGIVPVVVIENVEDAVPTARALLAGGVGVMEITLRTKAGLDAIKAVAAECPEMTVGAGTVLTLEQTQACVDAGAQFIVSPGFCAEQVRWCVEHGVAVTPGCVTPTEIMQAMALGVRVMKFFPANVYGGLAAMKALSGPFGNIQFIPTGGVNEQNIGEFAAAPFICAVGGSWLCAKADIAAHQFDKITQLCKEAVKRMMGFEIGHVGINMPDAEAAETVCRTFEDAFGFETKAGNSSNFSTDRIEVIKSKYLGDNGHLSVRTNNIGRAMAYLQARGFTPDMEHAKYKNGKMTIVYLREQIGGFAVHLAQK